MIMNLTKNAALGLGAGAGFDLTQRLMDHFLDQIIAAHPLLSWLS